MNGLLEGSLERAPLNDGSTALPMIAEPWSPPDARAAGPEGGGRAHRGGAACHNRTRRSAGSRRGGPTMAVCPYCEGEMKDEISCRPDSLVSDGVVVDPVRWGEEMRAGAGGSTFAAGTAARRPEVSIIRVVASSDARAVSGRLWGAAATCDDELDETTTTRDVRRPTSSPSVH